MELRDHPLISYRGLPSWPPTWSPANPKSHLKVLRGEIGAKSSCASMDQLLATWSMDEWSFWLSIVALVISVVSLPATFQMLWGGPRLGAEVIDVYAGGVKALQVHVHNESVMNRFLRAMRVHREQTDIFGRFSVAEAGSGKIILGSTRIEFETEKENGRQVTLASFLPAIFVPAVYREDQVIIILDDDLNSARNIKLDQGRYRITCSIYYLHCSFKFTAEFLVGATISEFYWSGEPKILRRK